MISGRRGAPGRLGALYTQLPREQIGIGYYESVGDATPAITSEGSTSPGPQVVSAPEPASDVYALTTDQRAARSALAVMTVFGAGVLAVWAGYRVTRSLRGQTA